MSYFAKSSILVTPFLSRNIYFFLFSLLGLVYLTGLFVPLMDNDSAHHANIALRMHLTGDYINLVDYGKDYLDKPHLHFWLCALSYKVFGVTGFAYKFPSLLFTILGTYSTFRLGTLLYNREIGKLASLLIATAFAYILANNDVRMDAILTATTAFATWQLVAFIQKKKAAFAAGAALGLALGFCTKGHIGVFVPAISALLYILYKRDWSFLINWKLLLLILLFCVFILPVVYAYYLQYNLHPEKIVRGKNNIDGVRFILLNQSIDRFGGEMGDTAKKDYAFFLHSFLWAFAPWSILAYIAIVSSIPKMIKRNAEWLTAGVFLVMVVVVSFSGFKLPHYLNIVFPAASVLAAAFIINNGQNRKWVRRMVVIQGIIVFLLLVVVGIINGWAFPVRSTLVVVGLILLLALIFYFLKSSQYTSIQKVVLVPSATMIFSFFLLNTNFYPQLLSYQGGNVLAKASRDSVGTGPVYFWKETYSSSYNFYTSTLREVFNDSVLADRRKTWLLYDIRDEKEILDRGYTLTPKYSTPDFEITKLNIKFINPAKRAAVCTQMLLAIIEKKK